MGCGIYKITNTVNEKSYIGSSIDLNSREYKHFWMLRRGSHDNIFLQRSFDKYGEGNFTFDIVEQCEENLLIDRENHFITSYNSNNSEYGYNLATVNEFRRNNFNEGVKKQISKTWLEKNGNFKRFSLINIETGIERIFESLVDGANYLIEGGYSKGKPRNVRMKLSSSLRGVKVNNNANGSIRKTCYKHKFKIIE